MPLQMSQLLKRLERHEKPKQIYGEVQKRAAVAIALQERQDGISLLMIQRAKREGDPWSGHMGFPGGRRDRSDRDDLYCAIRETREEIGVDLEQCATKLCELGEVNTGWRPDRPEMLVQPFVFLMNDEPVFTLNYEVDDTIWVPLKYLMDRSNRVPLKWQWKGEPQESDSYLYKGKRIWGLSLLMIDELLEVASH